MDFRFSQFEILTTAGALYLCLVFVCIFSEARAVEEELGAEVAGAVRAQNLFWASVEPSGQHIRLTGAAPGYAEKQKAGDIAAAISGVTGVANEIAIIGEAGTCQGKLDEHLKQERVTFKSGRADLTEFSFSLLTLLASIARNCDTRLEIAVHTDGTGDAGINLKLSQRRADAVRKYLVQSGVDPDRVQARGYGETQPLADNDSADGRDANRRVEFRVVGEAT